MAIQTFFSKMYEYFKWKSLLKGVCVFGISKGLQTDL